MGRSGQRKEKLGVKMWIRHVALIVFAVLQVRVVVVAAQAAPEVTQRSPAPEVTQRSPAPDRSQQSMTPLQRPDASAPMTSPSPQPPPNSLPLFALTSQESPSGNRRQNQSESSPEATPHRGPVQHPPTSSPTQVPDNSTLDPRGNPNQNNDPNRQVSIPSSNSPRPDSSQLDPTRQTSIRNRPDQARNQTSSRNPNPNSDPIQAENPQTSVPIPNSSRTPVPNSSLIRNSTIPNPSQNRSQSSAQLSKNLTPDRELPIRTNLPNQDRQTPPLPANWNGAEQTSATTKSEAATKASGRPQEARSSEPKATATEATSSFAPPAADDGNGKVVVVSDRVASSTTSSSSSRPPTKDEVTNETTVDFSLNTTTTTRGPSSSTTKHKQHSHHKSAILLTTPEVYRSNTSNDPPTELGSKPDGQKKSPRLTVQTQIYILSATFGGLLFMLIVLVLALALAIARMRSQLESTREAKYLQATDDIDNPSLQGVSGSPVAPGGGNNVSSYVNSSFNVGHEMEERASRVEPQTDLSRRGYEVYNGGGVATSRLNNQERGPNPVIPRARTLDESRRHHKLSLDESVVPSGHDRRSRESEEQRRSRVY